MKVITFISIAFAISLISGQDPYIFGTSLDTKGIANAQGHKGIAGSETTAWGLDDVSQSIAYANGTKESNARTQGEAIFIPQLHGVNAYANAINNGFGNSLADSVSKSFNPSKQYFDENYADYLKFLNSLFVKYPNQQEKIIKIVAKYVDQINSKTDRKGKGLNSLDLLNIKTEVTHQLPDNNSKHSTTSGNQATIANYKNLDNKSMGQTSFDYQRARGSGFQTTASSNSGTYRLNDTTIHQGDSTANAKQGWATNNSNNNGLGKINYINTEQNAGAYGKNAQTNSSSNIVIANGAVWNNSEINSSAEGKDSIAFSNINGNSYGYGALNGDTNSYTDGKSAVSKSKLKGAPYFPK